MSEPTSGPVTQALQIFVVENHPDTLKYLRMYLEDQGHVVQDARGMQEALAAPALADCDVLISDIGLPDGDGWELLRRARFHRRVYAIAMSGFGLGEDQARSRDAGYRQHLLKPFKPTELNAMLAEAAAEIAANR